jgi:hypothetical protein
MQTVSERCWNTEDVLVLPPRETEADAGTRNASRAGVIDVIERQENGWAGPPNLSVNRVSWARSA